jgi:hypothetical protein
VSRLQKVLIVAGSMVLLLSIASSWSVRRDLHLLATPFHHHHIENLAFVPPAQPTYPPSIDPVS